MLHDEKFIASVFIRFLKQLIHNQKTMLQLL